MGILNFSQVENSYLEKLFKYSVCTVPTVAFLYGQEVSLKKFSVQRHTVMMENPLVP
jgi:hypothetical protein